MIQNNGLEWLFRTVQKPLRLGLRYLRTTIYGKGIAQDFLEGEEVHWLVSAGVIG
jgi:UDP-N-acetyl-D-mannosaminuronic acid transferase (WecB/TagA/CpsF family)